VIVGRDTAGRSLRISSHPDSDRTVLSIWQGQRCLATVRLAARDVPATVDALVRTLLPGSPVPVRPSASGGGAVGSVTPLLAGAGVRIDGVLDRIRDRWAGARGRLASAVGTLARSIEPPPGR